MEDLDKLISEASLIEPKTKLKKLKPSRETKRQKEIANEVLDHEVTKAIVRSDPSNLSSRALEMAWRNFENAVGGRKALVDALEHCPEDSPAIKIVKKLFNNKDFVIPTANTLRGICLMENIPLNLVMAAFRDATMARLTVGAITQLAKEAPVIVDQLAADSKNRFEECPVCEGKTRVARIGENGEWVLTPEGEHVTQLCYQCRGTGKQYKEHDFANRRAFLQITGILDEKRGTTVNVDARTAIINENFQPGNGTFEKLIKAIDSVNAKPKELTEDIIDVPYTVYEEEPIISSEEAP